LIEFFQVRPLQTGALRLFFEFDEWTIASSILRSFVQRFFFDITRVSDGELNSAQLKSDSSMRAKKGQLVSTSTASMNRLFFVRFFEYLVTGDLNMDKDNVMLLVKEITTEQRRLNNGFRKQQLFLRALDQQSDIEKTFKMIQLLKLAFVEVSDVCGVLLTMLAAAHDRNKFDECESRLFLNDRVQQFILQAASVAIMLSCNGQRLQVG
jgi:hypothetical protein